MRKNNDFIVSKENEIESLKKDVEDLLALREILETISAEDEIEK